MVGDESSGSIPDLELVTTLTKAMKLDHPVNFELNDFEVPESVNFEGAFRNLMKKRRQMEPEVFHRDPSPLEENHRINGMAFDEKSEREKIVNLVGNGIISLLEGNSKLAVNKLQAAFDDISKFPNKVFENPRDYVWTKYAYIISLIEENNYSDLLHALKLLQELKKSLFSEVPVYHYAMAKLLIKFSRFRLAENEIKLCHDSMKDHNFLSCKWPGTGEIIKETTASGLEEFLNGLIATCGCYHKPDAVCKFVGCIEASSHPFPSREIFTCDADFKGYVVLTCQEGCKIQYHPLCWKKVKDAFSSLDKLSDKDCLGRPCVTPDCKNSVNEPSVIHKIEIIGPDGKVKSQCVPDLVAEHKLKEIASSKKRLRLKSDEHKTEKQTSKNKTKSKKTLQLSHAQSSEDIVTSMKSPTPKENHNLQISGFVRAKTNTPVKKKTKKRVEKFVDDASQKDFICSYFHMLLTKKGPFNKQQFSEEWDKFFPNIEPFYNLVPEKDWVFNLLKNSKYIFAIDDYLYASESDISSVESEHSNASSNVKLETNNFQVETKPYISEENAHIVSKMKEIEKEISDKAASAKMKEIERKFLNNSATNRDTNAFLGHSVSWLSNMQSTSTEMVNVLPENTQRETMLEKDVVIHNSNPQPQSQSHQSRPFSFGYFDESKTDSSAISSPMREAVKSTEVGVIKSPDSFIAPESALVREEFRALTPPVRWRDDAFDIRNAIQFYTGYPKPLTKEQILPSDVLLCKDGCCQTDPIPEIKSDSQDEIWVQHMQMAVNDLIKKNKELMKSKEQMELSHKNEVEALINQIHTLRTSYSEEIRTLKENQARNFEEDRRRMMALEARIKVQEGILQSTREELRKKDFDLLDAKKYLGIAILERLERESNKQVQRLVTALAVLPCSGPDADAVGQAMARWESAGDQASKAKNSFLEQCAKSQAILYEGFGSDSLQKLIIPIIEEPAGQCPLDRIALNLLSERENAEANQAKVQSGPSYERFPPYRVRPGNGAGGSYSGPSYTSYRPSSYHQSPTHVLVPMPLVSHGARPRETPPATNGETSEVLQSWPSTSSIPNSTKSSSPGNAAALTCSKKLFTELKKAYPSRSEDELWYAVVSVRRNNKNSLSGLPIKRIVTSVGNVLDWWPEPSEGSMGLDKFIGWAADAANLSEESSRGAQKSAWSSATLSPKNEADKEDCCICLQTMSSPKTELTCTHTFHTECIRKWLSKESVCPICRKFTRMADEFPTLK